MIKRYVSKPIQVYATQWTGDNVDEIRRILNKLDYKCGVVGVSLNIGTGYQTQKVPIGHYVIRNKFDKIEVLSEQDFNNLYAEEKVKEKTAEKNTVDN